MKDHKKIHRELSEQFGLPIEVIEKIVDSQFEFTKETISSGNDEPVRLQYLGVFRVKEGRREIVRQRRERLEQIRNGRNSSQ